MWEVLEYAPHRVARFDVSIDASKKALLFLKS